MWGPISKYSQTITYKPACVFLASQDTMDGRRFRYQLPTEPSIHLLLLVVVVRRYWNFDK